MAYNRIFLSHKGLDKDIVRQYRDVLSAMDLRPWMDESDLPAGHAPVRSLTEGMAYSSAAVFFVTPQYEDHGYLRSEIDDALSQKVARGDAFSIIPLVIADEHGNRGCVPEPLKGYIWKEPKSHMEGIRFIVEALPAHLKKVSGYLALQNLVPPTAKEAALVGQNLASRLGLDNHKYSVFLGELKLCLSRPSLKTMTLIMMTPAALLAIHAEAARDLRNFTLPRLRKLCEDLPDERRISVVFHPAATLSLLAVDWSSPGNAFALITPKFQRTASIDDRLSVLLDDQYFDSASLARMLYDGSTGGNGAYRASLREAPALLSRLISEAGLR